jgi:hypothetical protein
MGKLLSAAISLHRYLVTSHWDGASLVGPDVGVRFNYRAGRFVKGYLPFVKWKDSYLYLQAQSYWVLDNWRMLDLTGNEASRQIALHCSESILALQRADGAWGYPNREWRGRIATAEGTWASLGLLESYRRTANPAFLAGVLRWHRYLTESIGFQRTGDQLAVNYFAGRRGPRVPNNSAFLLRFLAELADVTGEKAYREACPGLLRFMAAAQLDSGEFPYTVPGEEGASGRTHFQCFQYNAFQCLDLMRYHEITGDTNTRSLIRGVLAFLRTGLAPTGRAFYQCDNRHTAVTYHTAAVAAALVRAASLGIDGYSEAASKAYSYLLGLQRRGGSFHHSSGDYLILADHRSYPRNLAMIAYHLLDGHTASQDGTAGRRDFKSERSGGLVP